MLVEEVEIAEFFKSYYTGIIKELVDSPQELSIDVIKGPQTYVIEVKVAKSDLGKVIGKGGKMAQALRTVLNGIAAKRNVRAILELVE